MRCAIVFSQRTPAFWVQKFSEDLKNSIKDIEVFLLERGDLLLEEPWEFILNLSESPLPLGCEAKTKWGVWFFRFGSSLDLAQFGKEEWYSGNPTQRVTLENSARGILKEGRFKSLLHSLPKHRQSVLSQIISWPGSVLPMLIQIPSYQNQKNTLPETKKSSFLRLILFPFLLVFRKMHWILAFVKRSFMYQQWNIGIVVENTKAKASLVPSKVQWLLKPKWPLCYADPFLVSFQEKKYLFAEKFDFLTKKGSIVSVAIDKDTALGLAVAYEAARECGRAGDLLGRRRVAGQCVARDER
jgi:hypothetical protein